MAGTKAVAGTGSHRERPIGTFNGFLALFVGLALVALAVWLLVGVITAGRPTPGGIAGVIAPFVVGVLVLAGLYTLSPTRR